MRSIPGYIFACLILAMASSAGAQTVRQGNPDIQIQVQPTETDQRIILARQFMRQNQYEQASALLEQLYQEEPDNNLVQNLLKQCYDQLKYYGKSEILTRRLIDQNPKNYYLLIDLAELLVKQGSNDSALAVYRHAFKLLSEMNPELAATVVSSLMNNGLEESAVKLIDSLRTKEGNPSLFALERAQALEKSRKYGEAVKEYLPLLDNDSSGKAIEAERRLLALLEFPESSSDVEKAMLAQSTATPARRSLGLLSAHYIKAGRFEEAFTFAIRQDSTDQSKGLSLLQYMRQCQERRAWSQVVRMGQYLTTSYPDSPFATEAEFRYADALAETGRWNEAIDVYHNVIARSPIAGDKSEALYKIGKLFADRLHNCEAALAYYDSVLALAVRTPSYADAQVGKPYCYLRLGDLDAAEKTFKELSGTMGNEEFEEEVAYNLAMLQLYAGRYDSTEAALRKLMVSYPRGFYVNDALQLVALLGDAKGQDSLLEDFAAALLYIERQMPDSARNHFQRLADNPSPTLADVALFRLANLEFSLGDSTGALGYLDKLTADYAESYFAPWGLKLKADMLILRPGTLEQGKSLYRTLLEKYPNYPFISDVRKRLRQLEEGSRIG